MPFIPLPKTPSWGPVCMFVCVCVHFGFSVMSDSLWPHWLQLARLLLSIKYCLKNVALSYSKCKCDEERYVNAWYNRNRSYLIVQSCLTLLWPYELGFCRQEFWSGLPFPFFRGSSWPRDWTWVSCLCLLYLWATGEAQKLLQIVFKS